MSFARYPEYKDSGVEWLGKVPEHWSVAALNYRYEVQLGKMLDEKRITGEHLAPYLRNIDVQWGRINVEDLPQMDFSGDDIERYGLRTGDLLVCEGGEVGRAAIWSGQLAECFYQKALHRLRARRSAADVPRFQMYLLRAAADLGIFVAGEGKSTIAHLTAEALRRYRFAYPAPEEQVAIVTFLDRETAKIDALIAEQERLIELLKEKRQAVISHAVTKGLDPDVPMKDSGVAWLGEVPAHWETWKLAHAFRAIGSGTTPPSTEHHWYEDGTVPWVTTGELRENVITETSKRVTGEALQAFSALRVHPAESLIIAMYGATIGRLGVLGVDATTNQACCVLSGARTLAVRFVFYWLVAFKEQLISIYATGGGQPNINQETVAALRIPAPDLIEQADIATFLDRETAKIDALVADATSGINLLKERRAALISAAVTGQIDVRGLAGDGHVHAD